MREIDLYLLNLHRICQYLLLSYTKQLPTFEILISSQILNVCCVCSCMVG